jgi:hypothetical protein
MAILLFFALQSLISLIELFAPLILWLVFLLLEKSGFMKFVIEQRPVKKMSL